MADFLNSHPHLIIVLALAFVAFGLWLNARDPRDPDDLEDQTWTAIK